MKLEVIRVMPNGKGGFLTKLVRKTIVHNSQKKEVFFVSGSKHPTVGKSIEIDMEIFKIKKNEHINHDTGEVLVINWLNLK